MKIKTSSVVTLSLLAGLVAATPKVLSQVAEETKFPLPASLAPNTKIKLGGSQSLEAVNKSFQQGLVKKFPGTDLAATYTSTEKGLEAVEKGDVEVAGVGRRLTAAEAAKVGVKSIGTKKIAIVVSDQNPSANINLTISQFADIYRGKITDWSKVGGTKGPIRVIDQTGSDTRKSFGNYPVFKDGVTTGSNVVKLTDNKAKSVAEKLGKDGIGYMPVDEVAGLTGVKVLSMHKTQPTDARYPFSQPMSYIYNKSKQSDGAKALLGFVDSPEGAAAITAAGLSPVGAAGAVTASPAAGGNASTAASPAASGNADAGGTTAGATATVDNGGVPWWLWLLLPLGLLGGLWALMGGKKKDPVATEPRRLNPLYSENDVKPTGTTGFTTGTTGFTTNRDGQDTGIPLSGDLSMPGSNLVDKAAGAVGNVKDQAGDLLKGAAVAGGAALAGGAAMAGGLGKAAADKSASLSGDLSGELPKIDIGNPLEGIKGKVDNLIPDLDSPLSGKLPEVGNPLEGLTDKGSDLLKGAAVAGGAALAGGAAMAGGLFGGNKGGEKSGDLKAEDSGFNLGDLGQGLKDKIGDVVEGTKDAGGAAVAGGAALAGGTAAALGKGAQSLWGSNSDDDQSGELSFETEISALNGPKSGDLDLSGVGLTPDPFDDSLLSGAAPEAKAGFNPFDAIGDLKDKAVDAVQGGGAAIAGGAAAAAGLAVGAGAAAKSFVTGDRDNGEDSGLLPEGQITLVSPNPAQAYVHWDVPVKLKRQLRQQGGRKLAVRMYDVTDADISQHLPSNFQEFECDELAWDLHLPVPRADRQYLVEIGYVSEDNQWLMLARSTPVMIRSNG
jgi:phosphate transport system substrate-binding protein